MNVVQLEPSPGGIRRGQVLTLELLDHGKVVRPPGEELEQPAGARGSRTVQGLGGERRGVAAI